MFVKTREEIARPAKDGIVRVELELASRRDPTELAEAVAILIQREGMAGILSYAGKTEPLVTHRYPVVFNAESQIIPLRFSPDVFCLCWESWPS